MAMKNKKEVGAKKPCSCAQSGATNSEGNKFWLGFLVSFGILITLLLIAGAIGGIWWGYKKYQALKNHGENLISQQQELMEGMMGEAGTMPGDSEYMMDDFSNLADRGAEDLTQAATAFKDDSVNYWNCSYRYSLYYPTEWTNNGMTFSSAKAEMYGQDLSASVNAVKTQETLDQLAARRIRELGGLVEDSRDKYRNGVRILAYEMSAPDYAVVFWREGNYGMEFRIFGASYANNLATATNMLATFSPNYTAVGCSGSGNAGVSPAKASSSQSSSFDCANWVHPNGDMSYWWYDISEEERQCYLTKYGEPPIEIDNWNDDVPYCDYANNPDCW